MAKLPGLSEPLFWTNGCAATTIAGADEGHPGGEMSANIGLLDGLA